jgi:hypothetical protein
MPFSVHAAHITKKCVALRAPLLKLLLVVLAALAATTAVIAAAAAAAAVIAAVDMAAAVAAGAVMTAAVIIITHVQNGDSASRAIQTQLSPPSHLMCIGTINMKKLWTETMWLGWGKRTRGKGCNTRCMVDDMAIHAHNNV